MRSKRACALVVCVLSACGVQQAAFAQEASANRCTAVLTSPTRDTVPLTVVLEMHAYDPRHALPAEYQFAFGAAARRHLVLPQPLGADLYEAREELARTAHLVIRGNYKATITADGRVVEGATIGGDRNRAFDDAVVAALRGIDSTDMLSMAAAGLPHDDVEIRVEITTRAKESAEGLPKDSVATVPLFAFRAPLRSVTQHVQHIGGTGRLTYPMSMRQSNIEGEVRSTFVVGADGTVEIGSLQVPRATQVSFVQAVFDALPTMMFAPLQVDGCAVRTVVTMPFTFTLRR